MKNYDFNTQLSPEQFENFGCDIVELRENIILERFKKNKDLGIDGRYISNEGTLIVQCKKFQNIDDLIRQLKNEELKKVKKINPKRYILVLSSNPTVTQKTKIYDLFNGFIHSPNDIITADDILSYLRKPAYSAIAKNYNELILSKNLDFNNFIETIQNPTLKNKSISLMNDIKNIQKYFIETKTYNSAYNSLLKNHIVFLSGDAGSGKSTNAKMQLNQLLEDKYVDFIYQIDSCEELSNLIISNKKIGILYDDFWGSTFSDLKLSLNNEKRLQNLLNQIDNMENIYFILTTREYVLNQGLSFYKDFYNKNLDKRIIHKNCNYTKQEKIKILFAHAKNSNLDFDYLYQIKFYANEIINSRNYSPRSISYFIEKSQDTILSPNDFINNFLKYLANPTDFLKSIFYKLSEGAQILAFVLSISDPATFIPYLKKSFQSITKTIDGIKPSLFDEYIKELFDFFITNSYGNLQLIEFTNYSIFDFINNEFTIKIIDYEDSFCNGVIYFNQINNLLMKCELSLENENMLIKYLIDNFDQLFIIHDDDIFLLAEDNDVDPITYTSHKIWKTIQIAKKTNNNILKNFLFQKINDLLHSYDNKKHDYEDKNFIGIPENIKFAETIDIKFCASTVIQSYLNNFNYLFELSYVKYFPEKYKKIIVLEMEKLGKNLNKNLKKRLFYELELLSLEGISEEFEYTINELPNILKMLKIPENKDVADILNNYKITPAKNHNFQNYNNKTKEKNLKIETEIEQFEKQLFYKKELSKSAWINIINQSSLNENSKKELKKITKEKNDVWSLISDSTINFTHFLLSFYHEQERKKQEFTTTKKIFLHLLEFINDSDAITFLKKYAYDTTFNNYSPLSNNHICTKYNISNSVIEYLINLGVLYKTNNIVDFGNTNFEIFLSIMYMKTNNTSKEDYLKFFLRDGILRVDELAFIEKFNAYQFNQVVLLPILDSILKQGINEFKQSILNIDFDGESKITSYFDELNLLDTFIESLFGISISSNISQLFYNISNSSLNILTYYTQHIDPLKNEQIDELCYIYFKLLENLYNFLAELKSNDNFSICIDENDNICFNKC